MQALFIADYQADSDGLYIIVVPHFGYGQCPLRPRLIALVGILKRQRQFGIRPVGVSIIFICIFT
jgi:hypothetical protein